jgi:hypothetical protein
MPGRGPAGSGLDSSSLAAWGFVDARAHVLDLGMFLTAGAVGRLPVDGGRLAGVAMRRFGEERGRDQRQDCKRQEGRK